MDLCRKLGTSERALRRMSAAHLGYPPLLVLGLARADAVARELRATDAKVTEIARICGFSGKASMTRLIRAFTGLPPRTYRASHRARSPVRK
ncbi:MAG: helix-turn-helix domain-containing protein [bacterium]